MFFLGFGSHAVCSDIESWLQRSDKATVAVAVHLSRGMVYESSIKNSFETMAATKVAAAAGNGVPCLEISGNWKQQWR